MLHPSSIQRYGMLATQLSGNYTTLQSGLIDNLSMSYQAGTNKLSTVTDNGQAEFKHLGFNQLAGSGQRTYRVKSVFWTKDSGYDHLGVKGDRYTTYYASNPWMPRIGGGAVSGETILGHELDHAYIQPNNKLPTIGVEIEGVRFQNYLTSVFGQGSMRTSYNEYRLKFSTDEKSYNPSGEKLTNFSEDFDKKTDNGDQYLGYSFNLTDNVNGVSSTGFILSVTTADGQYAYRKFDNKKEYDEALKRVQNLPKN